MAGAFLEAVAPAGTEAALRAEEEFEAEYDAQIAQWRLPVERATYEAQRAERRYRSTEPENRLVARTLEAEWEKRLREQAIAQEELTRRERQRSRALTDDRRRRIHALGADLKRVWEAATTTDRDRKERLRTLLEEVNIRLERSESKAYLTLRWRGGAIAKLDIGLRTCRTPPIRTDEDTIELVRRLAIHYSDAMIAGILNR